MEPADTLAGRVLVSAPHLWDPNFRRTLVFILDHTDEGAMGLVLNQPTELPARGLLADWDPLIAEPPVVFRGGPVQPESAIGLARMARDEIVGLVDLSEPPGEVTAVRIFSGYSGWGAGQLETEMAEDSWLVVDPDPHEVLGSDPGHLWEQVVDRLPGSGRLLRTMPSNPLLN